MLVRYSTTAQGKKRKLANIYTLAEHGISRDKIDEDALTVTRRLQGAGYTAYVVGGAVRDLLLGKTPNDFDIATDALPRKIRRVFSNSRVIGRRFKLVHVYFADQILEVSTFRSPESEHGMAVYGTMAEDVLRRDFTANALYYDPSEEYLFDFVEGYDDIKAGRLNALIPVDESFPEDPVRMIRAVRYAASTGLKMSPKIQRGIRKYSAALKDCSASRMTEEMFKILQSGSAAQIIETSREFDILKYILPEIDRRLSRSQTRDVWSSLLENLRRVDGNTAGSAQERRGSMIAALVEPFLQVRPEENVDPHLVVKTFFAEVKGVINPLTPPNADVDRAVRELMKRKNLTVPNTRRRRRRRN